MQSKLTAYTLFGVAAAALFLSTKLLIVLGTIHWLVSAILGLGLTPQLVRAAIMAPPALIALWRIFRLCYEAETHPANN